MIAWIVVFIFGAIVGSFLNVCIHRMPNGESVVWPSSHCPKCKKRIPAYDNIPFISYILLGGRCRFCKERISLRYPLVEFLTAGLFLLFYMRFGLSFDFLLYIVLVCLLITASFIDIAHRIIPDEVSLGGIVLGILLSVVRSVHINPFFWQGRFLLDSFLGVIVGGAIIYFSGFIFDLIYFKLLKKPPIQGETESMGGGDVKLLAMIGAFLGWKLALITFFIAPFFGLSVGVINLILKKDHTIPYGPFLSLAAILALFFGESILRYLFFL